MCHNVFNLVGTCGQVDRTDEIICQDGNENSIVCRQYSEVEFDPYPVPGICPTCVSRMTPEQKEKEKREIERKNKEKCGKKGGNQ